MSRCHDEMAPLPRCSPRRRNQWNNEVPRSWGWNSGGPSWAQRPNPSPSPAPMKSGISRSVADDKSVSVCPRLFPGPGKDPGWGETETQTQRPRDGSSGGHWGQPVCTALTSDPNRDQTLSHPWHCGRVVFVSDGAGMGQQKAQKPYCYVIFTVTPNGWCFLTVHIFMLLWKLQFALHEGEWKDRDNWLYSKLYRYWKLFLCRFKNVLGNFVLGTKYSKNRYWSEDDIHCPDVYIDSKALILNSWGVQFLWNFSSVIILQVV